MQLQKWLAASESLRSYVSIWLLKKKLVADLVVTFELLR